MVSKNSKIKMFLSYQKEWIHKTSYSGAKAIKSPKFEINFLSSYATCHFWLKIIWSKITIFRQLWGNFGPIFSAPKLTEMKILLCKWHMAIKMYLIKFFDWLLAPSRNKKRQKVKIGFVTPLDHCALFKRSVLEDYVHLHSLALKRTCLWGEVRISMHKKWSLIRKMRMLVITNEAIS